MGPVANLLAMDRTTLTAALKPLQRRGLVEISPDPSDGRSRILKLTREGRRLLARAIPVWQTTHGRGGAADSRGRPGPVAAHSQRAELKSGRLCAVPKMTKTFQNGNRAA